MSVYVVDASIAVKWFVPESDAEAAKALLTVEHELHAPDLIGPEVASALRKKLHRDEITAAEGSAMLEDFSRYRLRLFPTVTLLALAFKLASANGCTTYDALYVALAERLEAVVVTADRRLVGAFAPGPLARRVLSLNKLG